MSHPGFLLRQVHPSRYHGGALCLELFNPKGEEGYKLSVDNGDTVSAEEAYASYTSPPKELKSCAVYGIHRDECDAQELAVQADPLIPKDGVDDEDFKTNLHHMLIDFSRLGPSQRKIAAKVLWKHAKDRDPLYRPPST